MTEWTVNNKLNAWYQKRYHIKLPKEFVTKSEIYFGGSSFSPSALFALAEPGVWFDPSDLTTLFTDPAGTTPVTTPGQTVGLMLDKSKGLALGAELVTNGTFDTDVDGWTASNSTLSVDTQRLKVLVGTTYGHAYQAFTTVIGRTYRLTYSLTNGDATACYMFVDTAAGIGSVNYDSGAKANGTYTAVFVATATTTYVKPFVAGTGKFAFYDNISVRELAGNHATQATLAARPTYSIEPVGGRRNLLLQTEGFDTASWGKDSCTIAANTVLAPDGTTTADRIVSAAATAQTGVGQSATTQSGAAHTASYYVQANGARYVQLLWGGSTSGNYANFDLQTVTVTGGIYTAATITAAANGFYRITITSTVATTLTGSFLWLVDSGTVVRGGSYTGNGTSGIYVWGAQLELGSTATAYQRVTTQHDVTEAGVASVGYLYFDGSDDHMVTSTITPATDKAQVFIGVKKLSDANARGLLDYGPNWAGTTGSFGIYAPSYITGGLPAPKYSLALKGSTGAREAEYATYTAPITNVLSTLFDIGAAAASEAVTRINGAVATPLFSSGDAGGGNFSALALQIGRYGAGASVNVNLYSLITRFGPTLDAPTITSTETWVAGKTGIVI